MIFLRITMLSEEKAKVNFIHYMPFDEVNGLGKTEAQLKQEGVLVDFIPEPDTPPGKLETLFYNPTTNSLFYEYTDIPPVPPTTEQRVADLEMAISAIIGGAL